MHLHSTSTLILLPLMASLWLQRKHLNLLTGSVLNIFLRDGGDQHLDFLHGHGNAQWLD